MLSADQKKAGMLKAAYEDINRTSTKIEGEHDRKIRQKIEVTEQELEHMRSVLYADSEEIAGLVAKRLVEKMDIAK